MISIYSLPAMFALIGKLIIFVLTRRSAVNDFKTRLFLFALVTATFQGICEAIGLNIILHTTDSQLLDFLGYLYYVTLILTLTPLCHLAIAITFDSRKVVNLLAGLLYGYAIAVTALVLFTPLIIERFERLHAYNIIRIPGPAMGLLEIFLLLAMGTMVVLPFFGLRSKRPTINRNQSKLWIAGAVPANLLLLTVITLLHFGIRIITFSVTAPLFVLLMLAGAGYSVHTRRPIDLEFYFPWSRTHKRKKALYQGLDQLTQELSSLKSPEHVLQRLTKTLDCPVCLVYADARATVRAGDAALLTTFPASELARVERMSVTAELPERQAKKRTLLEQYDVGAIVPFFPNSQAACWLLLDRKFSDRIYSPNDFAAVAGLFDRLAVLLLDRILDSKQPVAELGDELGEWRASQERLWKEVERLLPGDASANDKPAHSLDDYVADFEKQLIEKVLKACKGHKSNAARLLGLTPSTLHYKLERYGLVVPLYQRKPTKKK